MIRTLDVHPHAENDLNEIWEQDIDAAAKIFVTLEQIKADPRAIDKLTTRGENWFGNERLDVKPWLSAGYTANLWRFRILDTPATGYRVLYGYQYQTRQLCVLAIAKKEEFDYDNHDSPIARRVLSDWRALFS